MYCGFASQNTSCANGKARARRSRMLNRITLHSNAATRTTGTHKSFCLLCAAEG